jgi:hypothetical protein
VPQGARHSRRWTALASAAMAGGPATELKSNSKGQQSSHYRGPDEESLSLLENYIKTGRWSSGKSEPIDARDYRAACA